MPALGHYIVTATTRKCGRRTGKCVCGRQIDRLHPCVVLCNDPSALHTNNCGHYERLVVLCWVTYRHHRNRPKTVIVESVHLPVFVVFGTLHFVRAEGHVLRRSAHFPPLANNNGMYDPTECRLDHIYDRIHQELWSSTVGRTVDPVRPLAMLLETIKQCADA
jgi:hypothetical protein